MTEKEIIIPTENELINLIGCTRHIVDGDVVLERHNAIGNNLKSYFQNSMDSVVDNAINSLFTTAEESPGGTEDGNDGIAIHDSDTSAWLTMVTTTLTPNNTYGKRWQGEIASLSQARTINESALGFNYDDTNPTHFETVYATQTFTGISLSSGANYIIEWEVYIQ